MIKYGAVLHIDCHVTLPWYYTLEQAHREIAAMEDLVNSDDGHPVELFIHMDPCIPRSCGVCQMNDCPQRRSSFAHRIPWNSGTVQGNRKHGEDHPDRDATGE
jgi:hypothetical protein